MFGQRQLARWIFFVTTACILVAGLWPFHAPHNEVAWSKDDNALHFRNRGSVLSANEFKEFSIATADPLSLELVVTPDSNDDSTALLAFDSSVPFNRRFALHKWERNLWIEMTGPDKTGKQSTSKLNVSSVFEQKQATFLTVASGMEGTSIYADGKLLRSVPDFRINRGFLNGELLISDGGGWAGNVQGLAIIRQDLSANEVLRDYRMWRNDATLGGSDENSMALYTFDEHAGSIVHNRVDSATNLVIPERYFVLHPQFLASPAADFRNDWKYWRDIMVNIVGFIPFGMSSYLYFCLISRNRSSAALVAVSLGFIVSLSIEILQFFLPTRYSGLTDVITNTFGTGLGVALWNYKARDYFVRCLPTGDLVVMGQQTQAIKKA